MAARIFAFSLCLALAMGCSKAKHSSHAPSSTAAANAGGSTTAAQAPSTSLPDPAANASGTSASPTLAAFAGTWRADCIVDGQVPSQFITTTQTITAIGLVSINTTYFTDKTCTTPIIQSSSLNGT